MDQRRAPALSKKATLQDVADCVGVSKMTVSAVLSGTSTTVRVSESTRARVLDAAKQLRYRPNALARSLRRRRTNIIGLYSGYGYLDPRNLFLSEIVGGVQEGCDRHKKDVLLHGVFRGKSVDDIYTELVDGRIDGLVITAPLGDPLVERLAQDRLPVVAVADALPAIPSVVVDDRQGARMLLDYLEMRGYGRFLYRSLNYGLESADRRRQAFMDESRSRGIEIDEWCAGHLAEPSDSTLERWISGTVGGSPAVICWNDKAAYDVLLHCYQRGITVPRDVAVTGYDGVETPTSFIWKLTSVRAPWAEVARTAIDLLVDELEGKEVPTKTTLPVELIVGDSA